MARSTDIQKNVDTKLLEERLDRAELAIGTMAQWLVAAQTGFNAKDAEGIEKILRSEDPYLAERLKAREESDGTT